MQVKVGFSTGLKNPLSWLIRTFTKSDVSHAWLLIEGAFMGHDMVMEAHETGYRLIPFFVFEKKTHVVRILTPKHPLEDGIQSQIDDLGSSYDFPGLFGNLFVIVGRWFKVKWRNPFGSSKAMFCSEAIVRAMQGCNYPGSEQLDPEATNPNDLIAFFQAESS